MYQLSQKLNLDMGYVHMYSFKLHQEYQKVFYILGCSRVKAFKSTRIVLCVFVINNSIA